MHGESRQKALTKSEEPLQSREEQGLERTSALMSITAISCTLQVLRRPFRL